MPAPEAHAELTSALASLAPKLREAFMLVEWFGLTPAEASGLLRIRASSVRSRVHRARTALREHFEEGV